MMFGWREVFSYAECPHCGSLHLLTVPADLGRFYPRQYYSLAAPARPKRKGTGVRGQFARWLLASRSGIAERASRLLVRKYPFLRWLRLCSASTKAAVLDVGCGSGGLLYRMRRWGFSNLRGVDPFTGNTVREPGLVVERAELAQVEATFDVIMFNHVLEHVADPLATLTLARAKLRPGGAILVRIPVAGSHLAQRFGANWFNLDAPRHLAIPSRRGMTILAERAGLDLVHAEYDGDEKSIIMSERYARDVPMIAPEMDLDRQGRRAKVRLARQLNRTGDGDLGVFVLRRPSAAPAPDGETCARNGTLLSREQTPPSGPAGESLLGRSQVEAEAAQSPRTPR
ncbi:hypothetical protein DB354_09285 [Opitutus sp. ER46]|nr:hypothetical protein DB354_09285 [Opitutus sp. ER46]